VGSHVIPESEVIQDLRVSAFIDGKTPDFSGPRKRQAADRLVEQYLMLQDAALSHVALPGVSEAQPLLDQIKKRYASEADYQLALRQAHITESQLVLRLTEGLQMMRYTDLRFRPEVQISERDLREYYDTMVSQWKEQHQAEIPSFEESRPQLEKLLTDQRVMQALDRWLGMTRTETQILYRDAAFK